MASIAPRPRTSPISSVTSAIACNRATGDVLDVARSAGQIEFAHHVDGREGRGTGHRVATVRSAQTAGVHGIEQVGATGQRGQAAYRRRCPWPS